MVKTTFLEFLTEISMQEWFTALHYRVALYLIGRKCTQAELTRVLGAKAPNINKVCKELIEVKILKVDSVQGRNKYLTTSIEWKDNQVRGQLSINL